MSGERRGRILVVDDEEPVRRSLAQILEDEGYEVCTAVSGEEGVEQAAAQSPDAVFLDIWLPGMDGIEALRCVRERGVAAPVIMISGHGTIETAVRATKLGAYDFVEKPLSLERVLVVAANALRHSRLERQNRALRAELRREAEFLGQSAAVERLRADLAAAVADGRPVLLHGEKGVGRRLAARWIAAQSRRPDAPFLDVQASALTEERLVRALFGDEARAGQAPGRIALADEGTLYVENGDHLPAAVQTALVAGLRSGEFVPPGGGVGVRSEPLVVLALLEAPDALAAAGRLSAEFLAAFGRAIPVPPLRARRDDLPALTERFLGEMCREYARDELTVTPEAMAALLRYDWPGNVRELQRVVERLVLLAPGPQVGVADLPARVMGRPAQEDDGITGVLRRFEASWLKRHIDEAGGDIARAAARLGVGEQELRARMTRLEIP